MFCTKCGNLLEDNAKFCEKCGTAITINSCDTSSDKTKIIDNEVQLSVKPTYKSFYFMWITYFAIVLIMILFTVFASMANHMWSGFIIGLVTSIVILAIKLVGQVFKKKQINSIRYDFYKTKVVYSDSFLEKVEKEVRYKHIKECVLIRYAYDRIFGYGTIILYTNAESGFGNGIRISCLENSEEIYRKIKELIEE